MTFPLEPEEHVIKEGGASHVKGIETVGGHLWLTNMRLHFKSHAINIQTHEESYWLRDVVSVKPHDLVPTWLTVTLKDGRNEKFVVFGRAEWLTAIQMAASIPGESTPALNIPVTRVDPASPAQSSPLAAQGLPNYAPRAPKDRSLALVFEILPGLFGILGIGWIYSGQTTAGLLWLGCSLGWGLVAVITVALTSGFGCFCTVPISLILLAVSATSLNSYTKSRPELFGP